jgi:hypothetical protein
MNDRIEELLSILVASQVLERADFLSLADTGPTGPRSRPTRLHILEAIDQLLPVAEQVRSVLATRKP